MPDLTGAPTPPSLNDPASFNVRALAFLAWMSDTLVPEIEALSAADWFDVMANLTDGTDGRVMTVGAFGLGESAPPIITDINEVTLRTGFYTTINTTAGDFPTYAGTAPASKYGKLMVHRYGGGDATQTYHVVGNAGGSAGRTFRRTYNTGTAAWLPWVEVFDSASVERGSNANGEYVRFPDGTQICWQESEHSNIDIALASATYGYRHANVISWNYPAAFASASEISFLVTGRTGSTAAAYKGTTLAQFFFVAPVSVAADTRYANKIAIGRWF